MFNVLLHSGAFWTATIAVISAVVMFYANIPTEIWVPIEAWLGGIVLILFGSETAKTFARERVRVEAEQREKEKSERKFELG